MARVNEGSHNFTCHPHVYPQVEWTIPAFTPQPQRITALWLILMSRPTEGTRLSWPDDDMVYFIRFTVFRYSFEFLNVIILHLKHVISCVCQLHNKEYNDIDDDDDGNECLLSSQQRKFLVFEQVLSNCDFDSFSNFN